MSRMLMRGRAGAAAGLFRVVAETKCFISAGGTRRRGAWSARWLAPPPSAPLIWGRSRGKRPSSALREQEKAA